MKKLLLLILSLSMATVAFSSCSFLSGLFETPQESSSSIEAPSSEKEEKVYKVTFVQNGKTVKEIEVKEGGSVAETDIPELTPKTGYKVEWEKIDLSNITADVEVKAVKIANTYTITFDTDGGDAIAPLTVTFDSNVTLPEPTREGYTFNYWLDADGKIVDDGKWTLADNITLKADWKEDKINTYTITFKTAEGTVLYTRTVTEGETLTDIPVHEIAGYDCSWDVDDFSNITANVDVTLVTSPKTYTITYDAGEGLIVSGEATQTVTYNSEYTLEVPTANRDGYTFGGWQAPENMPAGGIWTLADNVTLTAIWNEEIPNVYTINFMTADGATVLYTRTITEGETLTDIPAHEIAGYDCTWSVTDFSNITANISVTLVATPKTYTITYDPGEGTIKSGESTQSVLFNETFTLNRTVAERTGFNFGGWQAPENMPTGGVWTLADNVTLTAIWTAKTVYTVTFAQPGQTPTTYNVEEGQALTERPTLAAKPGYTLAWDPVQLAKLDDVQENVTIGVIETANTYTVTYSDAKGGFSGTITVTYDAAYDLSANQGSVTGYHVDKFTLQDGTEIAASGTWTIASDVTVVVNWAGNVYTVVLNAGANGTCSESQITVTYGQSYTLPVGTPNEGYAFEGWKLNGALIPLTGIWEHTAAGTIELTASWQSEEWTKNY